MPNQNSGRSHIIINQAEKNRGVRQDGCRVDMDLVAAVQEWSEVHLDRSGDMIECNPFARNEPH